MPYKRKRGAQQAGNREKGLIALAAVAVAFSVFVIIYDRPVPQEVPTSALAASVEDLSTDGFVEVQAAAETVNGEGVISLTGGCHRITAGTDPGQAESVKNALDGVIGPRPNTHELMRDAFEALDIEVIMAKVTELRDSNFYGKILLRQGDTILSLDSKPSDGIALALRTDAKIYFNQTLLQEQGQKVC